MKPHCSTSSAHVHTAQLHLFLSNDSASMPNLCMNCQVLLTVLMSTLMKKSLSSSNRKVQQDSDFDATCHMHNTMTSHILHPM